MPYVRAFQGLLICTGVMPFPAQTGPNCKMHRDDNELDGVLPELASEMASGIPLVSRNALCIVACHSRIDRGRCRSPYGIPVGWVPTHLILAVESFATRANFFFLYIREFVTYCVESGTWGGGAILVFVCGGGRPRAVAEGPRACVILHVC